MSYVEIVIQFLKSLNYSFNTIFFFPQEKPLGHLLLSKTQLYKPAKIR